MTTSKINIAIDGFSSCGKSTIAKELAKRLEYIHIDSGAMYRAVTLSMIRKEIDFNDALSIKDLLDEISIEFKRANGLNLTILNGEDVSDAIRSKAVNDNVSEVATIHQIREALVGLQHDLAQKKGVIMDGRDIGTVVLPDAEVKLFITADVDVRAKRRLKEIQEKGNHVTFEDVKRNLLKRDMIDSSRKHSPLKKAEDAIVLDNSYLSQEEQLEKIINIIHDVHPEIFRR